MSLISLEMILFKIAFALCTLSVAGYLLSLLDKESDAGQNFHLDFGHCFRLFNCLFIARGHKFHRISQSRFARFLFFLCLVGKRSLSCPAI